MQRLHEVPGTRKVNWRLQSMHKGESSTFPVSRFLQSLQTGLFGSSRLNVFEQPEHSVILSRDMS